MVLHPTPRTSAWHATEVGPPSPRVSVVVPCYNLGRYLDEAVGSVLDQTYQDFEILILDDGSTDAETRRIIDDFKRPRTTVFRTKNRGLAAARNFLLARARGELISALDADDRLHPQFLEKTVAVLDADPTLTFVSTRLQMFGDQEWTSPTGARCDIETLLCDDTVVCSALVRRAAVLAVGAYDEAMPHQGDEDWDLWLTLVERRYRGTILPDVLFFYRRRPGSLSVACTTGRAHLDLVEYILRKHRDSYDAHLMSVLRTKEDQIGDLRCTNMSLEARIAGFLAPAVERKRAEVVSLQEALRKARQGQAERDGDEQAPSLSSELERQRLELDALRAESLRARQEASSLRASWSWKVTAPLRRAYEVLRLDRLRGRS